MGNPTAISFNPRSPLPTPTVKSRLVSRRELGAAWRLDREALLRGVRNTNVAGQLQRQINKIPVPGLGTSELFPFLIYHLPVSLRPGGMPNPDGLDWRRVRVRAGRYMASTGPIDVVGTDNVDNPDIETYLDDPTATDILVNANDPLFYFWVTYNSGTATVYYGDSVAASSDPTTWPTFPSNDATHTLIGWCDSQSLIDQTIMQVQQIQRTDIAPAGSGGGGTSLLKGVINTVSGNPDIYANYFIVSTGSTATATSSWTGSVSSITVSSVSGTIVMGMHVGGAGIYSGTTVSSVSGTTIGLSHATTGTESGAALTFSAALVRVAKNAKLRNSVTSETIDGNTFTYTYGASYPYAYVARLLSTTGYSEYQVITPRYLAGDEIWYYPVSNASIGSMVSVADTISATTGAAITFLDDNEDARAWTKATNQSGYE